MPSAGRLARFLPSPDRRRIVTVRYDGNGVLRSIPSTADVDGLQNLVLALDDLDGVEGVALMTTTDLTRGR